MTAYTGNLLYATWKFAFLLSLQFYHEIIHTEECEYKYDNEQKRHLYIHSVCLYMYVYTTEQKVK